MITLITPWYNSPNNLRQVELVYCLERNIANPHIDKIVLFAEHMPHIYNEKVTVLHTGKRATFNEMLGYETEGIKVIANTDICFDDTIKLALGIKQNQCYALSRYDKKGEGLKAFHGTDTQDVWIFNNTPKGIGNYSPGMPGCDNRIAREIKDAGFEITNPCLSIIATHVHESGYRTYTPKDTVHGEYHYVHISKL